MRAGEDSSERAELEHLPGGQRAVIVQPCRGMEMCDACVRVKYLVVSSSV